MQKNDIQSVKDIRILMSLLSKFETSLDPFLRETEVVPLGFGLFKTPCQKKMAAVCFSGLMLSGECDHSASFMPAAPL
jgi:hypothetical protein